MFGLLLSNSYLHLLLDTTKKPIFLDAFCVSPTPNLSPQILKNHKEKPKGEKVNSVRLYGQLVQIEPIQMKNKKASNQHLLLFWKSTSNFQEKSTDFQGTFFLKLHN